MTMSCDRAHIWRVCDWHTRMLTSSGVGGSLVEGEEAILDVWGAWWSFEPVLTGACAIM
jgi:hypothetical protein